MMQRPKNLSEVEQSARRIAEIIEARGEWFYTEGMGRPSALRRNECEVSVLQGRLIFSCWADAGARSWRILAWEWTGEKLLLEATRRMGAERSVLELIPRASASASASLISATRRERCAYLSQLVCAEWPGAKVLRAGLSAGARRGQPGRYARIMLRRRNQRIAVAGPIAEGEAHERDAFLSSALLWFMRAREQSSGPTALGQLWLVVGPELIEPIARQLALLRNDVREAIRLYELDERWQTVRAVPLPERAELWTEEPRRLRPPRAQTELSGWARRILSLSPEAIDVVRARHGETLRFRGLAFARVRRTMNNESAWLGIEGQKRRPLGESNWHECVELMEQLKKHRSAAAADYRHALYRQASEAWLESLLRRDITRLDPNLRLAPLHAQFRTTHNHHAGTRPVDLLALRRDGRLVVIELKVAEDREHVLQGADYWRRIEAHRRYNHLQHARLFDDAVIADEPPLVYLVAPTLRFHRAFRQLARLIAPDIELHRFELNEDWRACVRVMRRTRVN